MIKWCLSFIVAIAAYIGLEQLIELSTRGFWVERIKTDNLPYQEAFATTPPTQEELSEVKKILAQPFYLMGSGSECFAFISQDQQTVIKLFKLDHLRPVYIRKGMFGQDLSRYAGSLSPEPSYQKYLPSFAQNFLNRMRGIREFRIDRTFRSVVLAYNELKEETALVYTHLNPSNEFTETLTLYDSSHIAHKIDPNTVRFVIQKTATPFIPYVHTLIEQGKREEAKKSLSSLIDLLIHRCQQGLSDRDMIPRNLGFVDGKAIEIDTGSFALFPQMKESWIYTQEICYATLEIKSWLKQQDPKLAAVFGDLIDEKISNMHPL